MSNKLNDVLSDLRSGLTVTQIASRRETNETYVRAVKNLSGMAVDPASASTVAARRALEGVVRQFPGTTVARLASRISHAEYNRRRAAKAANDDGNQRQAAE